MFRKEFVRGCIPVIAGLVIWEILTRLLLEDELLIPPPSSVVRSFWTLALNGQRTKHFLATLVEFAYGFITACILGVSLVTSWVSTNGLTRPWILGSPLSIRFQQ